MSIFKIFLPLGLHYAIQVRVNSPHFLLWAELLENFREISRVILVIHLS